jgi:hypothetical protein
MRPLSFCDRTRARMTQLEADGLDVRVMCARMICTSMSTIRAWLCTSTKSTLLNELWIHRHYLTLTKCIARKPLCGAVCDRMSLTFRPLERSPTAHWAKRAYNHHHQTSCVGLYIVIDDNSVLEGSYTRIPSLGSAGRPSSVPTTNCLLWVLTYYGPHAKVEFTFV